MRRDRDAPPDLFALVPDAALAFDPVLARRDVLLDDDDRYQRVRADLATRYPADRDARAALHPGRGHPAAAARAATVRLELRRGRAFRERQPGAAAMLPHLAADRAGRHHPHPLGRPHRAGDGGGAQRPGGRPGPAARVTRGRKPRIDGAVVETTIRHPTDSKTLGDGVRVIGRLLRRARRVLDGAADLRRRPSAPGPVASAA